LEIMKMTAQESLTRACFSLGSNMGDRAGNLERAGGLLVERIGILDAWSGTYESEAWGYESAHRYYNCCLVVWTHAAPLELIAAVNEVEKEFGRIRSGGAYSDRIIDIDLLLYGDLLLELPGLTVPHPRMRERRFVLGPLAEIAPDWRYPGSGETIRELLDRCDDPSEIHVISPSSAKLK
jgi:2-amino-4-hydroxy-6-hydroxymethyldihydropteridine diphosphokinase